MKYAHICRYVAETPWAIHPAKFNELLSVLLFRAGGGEFTAEEIEARIGPRGSAAPVRAHGVAVVPIRGVLAHRMSGIEAASGGMSTEQIGSMLKAVMADESVGTILFDIDSPGGTVPGVQELAAQMFAIRGVKRQVAHVNSLAASAAYWLASQADEIVSTPSGAVGSIGVFTAHQNLSKALEQDGIDVTLISAGKHKVEGNPFEPLSDEARDVLQGRVDRAYAQFVKDVARGRGVTPAAVRGGYGEGRALDADEAKAAGLIDRIGTFDDTLGRVVGRRAPAGVRAEWVEPKVDLDGTLVTASTVDEAATEADHLRRLERF